MKVICCCLTCIVGNDDEKLPEESYLIKEEKSDETVKPVLGKTVKTGLQKHSSTGKIYDWGKVVQKVRKDANIKLKISIKIRLHSEVAKISAVDAINVLPSLLSKSEDTRKQEEENDKQMVQIRTKILPSEARGHSNKYIACGNMIGTMKFQNDCLHTIPLQEFNNRSVRFRLYHVYKHQRDILLGEYVLNLAALNLEIVNSTTNIVMQLHNPLCTSVEPPEVSSARMPIDNTFGSSTQSSRSSNQSFTSILPHGDTTTSSRTSLPSYYEAGEERVEISPLSSRKTLQESSNSVKEDSGKSKLRSSTSPLDQLRKTVQARTENLSEVQEATEEMSQSASTFVTLSAALRDKYQEKQRAKKIRD